MKAVILACLLALALSQTYLVLSDPSTTTLVSPAGQFVGIEPFHTANNPNYQGSGANWIFNDASLLWPDGYVAKFQAIFLADCPHNLATLRITADNEFRVWLNGVYLGFGNNWYQNFLFYNLTVNCGRNNLTVEVTNRHNNSPAGLVFTVLQDQTDCFNCLTPLAFYNRDTCRCECTNQCECNRPLTWFNYPICQCQCPQSLKCPPNKYFDKKTCSCKCVKKLCPFYSQQNPDTCECKGTCVSVAGCPEGQTWDTFTCRCIKVYPICKLGCIKPKLLNPITCSCFCPPQLRSACPVSKYWNETNCQCQDFQVVIPEPCNILCIATHVVDPVTCTCVCPPGAKDSCTITQYLDNKTCQCTDFPLCNIACIATHVVDPITCTCVCPQAVRDACPIYKHFNEDTCQCEDLPLASPCPIELKRGCLFPRIWHEDTCTCEDREYSSSSLSTHAADCGCN